jgi:transmembrane sensor
MIREVLTLARLRSMTPKAAAALIALHRADRLPGEDAVVAQWLSLDPAHERAWGRAQRAWSGFDNADDDELLIAMLQAARTTRPVRANPGARWAAVIAAVAVLGGLLLVGQRLVVAPPASNPQVAAQGGGPPTPNPVQTYAVGRAPPRVFALADGSRLTLDADTTVTAVYAGDRRELTLARGRAFFEVAHNSQRPFVVHAAGRDVVDVGTQFEVQVRPERMRVVLVEGRVTVNGSGSNATPIPLRAGQQLVAEAGRAPVVSAARVQDTVAWRNGMVTFQDTPLSVAVVELNRYGEDQLVVRDPRIGRLLVSGAFKGGDAARFGRILSQIHPVRIVQTGPHTFEIRPR